MHELGLMTGVMDAAVEAAREAGATRLLGVRVSIGEATEAVEDALVFAFEALAEADPFTQGATLDLTMIRPRSVCLECGHEFEHDLYNRFCPVCDSFATELLAGRELQIDSIEVDLPENRRLRASPDGRTPAIGPKQSAAILVAALLL